MGVVAFTACCGRGDGPVKDAPPAGPVFRGEQGLGSIGSNPCVLKYEVARVDITMQLSCFLSFQNFNNLKSPFQPSYSRGVG